MSSTAPVAAGQPSRRPGREPADRRLSADVVHREQVAAIVGLVREARASGEDLTGPHGLLKRLTKLVLEAALEEEMSEHLGHAKHQPCRGVLEPAEGLQARR